VAFRLTDRDFRIMELAHVIERIRMLPPRRSPQTRHRIGGVRRGIEPFGDLRSQFGDGHGVGGHGVEGVGSGGDEFAHHAGGAPFGMRVQARKPLFAHPGQKLRQNRLGAFVFVDHPVGEGAQIGDGGGDGFGAGGAGIPDVTIAQGVGDHAEGFGFVAARLALGQVQVGRRPAGVEQRDERFFFVMPFDHRRTITSSRR
jgi:hypothetical protein